MVTHDYDRRMIASVRVAKARLSELIERAAAGEEVVITRHDKPVARLVPEGAQRLDEVRRSIQGLRDLQQVLGKMIDATVPAGALLQGAQLRVPYVVKMNQPVRLLARGEGFAVGSDAIALGNAGVGERVDVRVGSGKVVSAVVEDDGTVSVNVP